ncbi:MAG: sulfur reduction protein DsrS [Gammaproteobacteria bacterium]|nr:sulfur reduction protein DsrS [Gammaproteobacteria bacterium]
MELSSEDSLRLNVLLANKPRAIRIDESSMTLYGLSEKGEAKIPLNPNCRDDQYLKILRELLSGNVLGSPGGYPVYLQRWTRMGQTRDENLEQLLLLGEPEAVVAVACAAGLTDELARRAWWTSQDPDNARRMLQNPAVVNGSMGPELADFLIEYLPFESEPEIIVESLRLALQPGLIDEQQKQKLWMRCSRKPTYYLGFLASIPDDLPEQVAGRSFSAQNEQALNELAAAENPYAKTLLRVSSPAGQAFLNTVAKVMEKPANQDVVTILLDVLRGYFAAIRSEGDPNLTMEELAEEAQQRIEQPDTDPSLLVCLANTAGLQDELRTLRALSGLGYGVVRPIFRRTDAIGSLMRRKLEPVSTPLVQWIRLLQGQY